MSARIPHLLTRLLSSSELDALENEMLDKAAASIGKPACVVWAQAVELIRTHRNACLFARTNQTPSARRKSLGVRPATPK